MQIRLVPLLTRVALGLALTGWAATHTWAEDGPEAKAAETPADSPAASKEPAPAPAPGSQSPPPVTPVEAPPQSKVNESAHPAATAPEAAEEKLSDDGKLTFNFRYQPWQDVLDWFADQAGLSLILESPPPGTFNYRDARRFTVPEALDVINGVLLTKGYTLVRHDRMLVLVNLEDGIPPNLVPDVPLADLDKYGEYELVRVLFPVWNMTPEQAAEEVQPLLGPQGKAITLPQARQIQVTETGGRLRTIRSVIDAVEQPEKVTAGMREFELKYVTLEAAMPTIRQMLGIPADAFSTPDSTVQITKAAIGNKLLFRGTAQQATRLEEILRLIDIPEAASGIGGTPQLEVYSINTADPEAVLKVLQTLMAGESAVTLATDAKTGNLIAFATPSQQATIRATIDQMQKDARQVDVISLSNVDPQVAVLAINKLFGGGSGEEADPKAPRVDADITTRSLMVRGTTGQVDQIRDLLRKLGETEEDPSVAQNKQHVRLLPLTGSAARSAITQIEQIWPSVRSNRIRIVSPSSGIPVYRPSDSALPPGPAAETSREMPIDAAPVDAVDPMQQLREMLLKGKSSTVNQDATTRPTIQETPAEAKPESAIEDKSTQSERPKSRFHFASDEVKPAVTAPIETDSAAIKPVEKSTPAKETPAKTSAEQNRAGAPIMVAPGPGGLLIASDDLEALDQLEQLLSTLGGRSSAAGREFAVFYLKYSKAATIAEVLAAIFGGKSAGNDRGLLGDMASNALGDVGGGLMGDLLLGGGGGGGGSFASAAVDIIPDPRLNALVVHAKPADLDTIEQLLKVLDQRTGPEDVEADAPPRSIQVVNTSARTIATIIQQVYQDRVAGGGGQMSPQDMMRMIRGGNNPEQQIQKMSIGVDERNNLLVVRAPDPLFEEVKALVQDLDQSTLDSPETTRVVSLRHTNSSSVQKALTSILNNVTTSTTAAQTHREGREEGRPPGGEDSPGEEARRQMRRQWEFMREMQEMRDRANRGGGPGGFRGRGGDRGGDRGGGDRGGGGGDRGGGGGPRGRGN